LTSLPSPRLATSRWGGCCRLWPSKQPSSCPVGVPSSSSLSCGLHGCSDDSSRSLSFMSRGHGHIGVDRPRLRLHVAVALQQGLRHLPVGVRR
jgi:hypothetical protein